MDRQRAQRLSSRWWLIAGSAAFAGIALYSSIRSFTINSFSESALSAIDWLAAAVVYFFLGALIGHAIQFARNRSIRHPLFIWLTLAFWAISSILAFIFIGASDARSVVMNLFFPFAYGVFFTGFAFFAIFPWLLEQALWWKYVLDTLFISIFGTWLYLEIKNRQKKLRTILLVMIFITLFVGMVSCVTQFAGT